MEETSKQEFWMVPGIQSLVNAQVDINRAVWAGNALKQHAFKNEAERMAYIKKCARSAIKDLHEYLKESENLLF